ncbi:MAG: penicillin-binding protein 2 [Candidatus Spechtbacterales bacterium]
MGGKIFKKFKINLSPREDIQPEEIFFDSAKIKEFEHEDIDTGKLEKPISDLIFSSFEFLQIAVIVFLAVLTGFIVIARGDKYGAEALDNSLRAIPIVSQRGLIYSSDGIVLAKNEIYFDVLIKSAGLNNPSILTKDFFELSNSIALILGKNSEVLYKKFQDAAGGNFFEYAILKGISNEEIQKIASIIAEYPFLEVREAPRRRYPSDLSFSHILGYTGELTSSDLLFKEYSRGARVGKVGVEAFYDDVLRGDAGIIEREVDSRGSVLSETLKIEARNGVDVTLHINAALQEKVHGILKKHAKVLGVNAAVAILSNPRGGGIVALVSIPSFDANLFEHGIGKEDFEGLINDPKKPMFNRAIGGEYPSGSTIKPIIAAAALEEGLITSDFLVYSDGVLEVPSAYNSEVIYEFKDWKAHGWSDLRKAIADSVNIYFYTIGGGYKDQEGLGIKNIEKYLKEFNWGSELNIDLPGERTGLIPTPKWKKERKGENWYIGDTYLTSIGQGDILVTPMQISASIGVFANGGTLFTPKIVSRVGGRAIEPNIINKDFIAPENIKVVREGMRQAVLNGSSRFLSDFSYKVAGKTGTAQTANFGNHAWFTGFAPYEDPEIVVTVLLEGGDKSDYAVRAAKEILEAYFEIYPQY